MGPPLSLSNCLVILLWRAANPAWNCFQHLLQEVLELPYHYTPVRLLTELSRQDIKYFEQHQDSSRGFYMNHNQLYFHHIYVRLKENHSSQGNVYWILVEWNTKILSGTLS